MTPILYESDEKEFWSKGLGPLSDAEKCTVTEERNGAYTLSMTYPIDGAQADKIANNRIIKADNAYDLKGQLFVIKTVTPIMTETGEISLSVYAEHISYITNDLSIPPELSLTGTAQQALDQWKDSLIGGDTSGITVDSDVTNTSSTLLTIQNVANARQALGGVEGSILYCWKGEYKFDNLHISLKKQRGTTANTLLSYGRNLLTFEQEQNIAETYTTLYPYALVTAAGGMIQKLVTIDGYLVDSKYVSHYPNRKIKTHDFTSDFQNYRIGAKPSENAEEGVTYADLATIKKYLKGKALHFMTTNDIGVPKISTTITFADLSKTDDELAKFEKLSLCDKVPVRFEKLGINSAIKVTRTVWNVLTDSYDSIELGDLNMTIGETVASVSAETSAIKTKVNQASVTAQIAADGTHNIFRTDDETEPIAKKVGDLWYKTDGKYTSMYQWDGKAWALIVNTRDTADVRAELDQAKSDMTQAKTDAQTAYDEAVKATNTANGAKAQTAEALKQAKQANDSYTALAKEVADNKTSTDADYKRVNDNYTALAKEVAGNKASVDADVADIRKAIDANKASADADWKQAQEDYASVSDKLTETNKTVTDIKTSVNGIKTTVADNTGKISTMSQTVNGVKTSVANAQGDIATIKIDISGTKQTVADAQKDITSIKTSVNGVQTDITNAKKDITSVKTDISGVKTSVSNVQGDVTSLKTSVSGVQADVKNAKGDITSIKADVSGVKTTIAGNTGKITQLVTDVNGVKTTVGNAQGNIATLQIDAKNIKATVSSNTGKISTMQADVNGIKTNVKNAQGDISSLQTDAKSIKATVSSNTGKITQLTTDVNGVKSSVSNKVDKTTYQSYVTQTDKALSAKLTASDLKGYAKTADVKQTTDGLSASITKVQGDLSSLQIGGTNLLDDTAGPWKKAGIGKNYTDVKIWTLNAQLQSTTITVSFDYRASTSKSFYCFFFGNDYAANGKVTSACNSQGWVNNSIGVDGMVPISPTTTTTWKRVWIRYNLSKIPPAGTKRMLIGRLFSEYATSDWLEIRNVKLESGNKATDWCMSDNDVQSQLNTLSGKITATSDRLSSVYTKSETDAKMKTKVEQSALTQTSNSLSASIAKNSKILSSAGLVNENAYINANKIALNGKTLMSNATINDAFIGNMSANKITTGTLNAAKVNLINVNASNISTGTLNSIKITSTGKDPSGTSSTTKIESGYIDTNVINCSDYILVGKADADPRKRWQTKQDKWGMWFQTPAKLNGHTGNAPSDWQSEWQGFIRGDGWNYETETVTGNGASGIAVAITPQQIWGRPYGGDYFQIGVWEPSYGADSVDGKKFENGWCSPRFVIDEIGQLTGHPHSITLGDTENYTGTYNHGNLNILDGNLHVKPNGSSGGIRTAWVSWSDCGNEKCACIVQDANYWGGIALPKGGDPVIFNTKYRVSLSRMANKENKGNTGWGD